MTYRFLLELLRVAPKLINGLTDLIHALTELLKVSDQIQPGGFG